jgi:hypothetical protein
MERRGAGHQLGLVSLQIGCGFGQRSVEELREHVEEVRTDCSDISYGQPLF